MNHSRAILRRGAVALLFAASVLGGQAIMSAQDTPSQPPANPPAQAPAQTTGQPGNQPGSQPAGQASTPPQPAAPAASAPATAQAPAQNSPQNVPVIKSESRVVRVDTIVTDKKGHYIQDLQQGDFKLYEDNKEQPITNFSFGKDPAAPTASDRHYTILLFDYSTMAVGDQAQARAAAVKFVEADTGPNRVMAVFEFGGALQLTQNFTADPDKLKKAVAGIKTSGLSPDNQSAAPPDVIGSPSLGNPEMDFGNYTLLLAIRSVAKNLADIPGRKTLILLTSGFVLTPELQSELTATIDACNKANVAVYPLDVRGLVTPNLSPTMGGKPIGSNLLKPLNDPSIGAVTYRDGFGEKNESPKAILASLVAIDPDPLQARGGGGGGGTGGGGGGGRGGTGGGTGGGGTGGGGTGGSGGKGGSGGTGGGTGTGGKGGSGTGTGTGGKGGGTSQPYGTPLNSQPRSIVPTFPPSATDNQQFMYELASGTGGFPILNTNDLLSGLDKIAHEQDEYYLLGFAPQESPEGSCHVLRVKVERGGTEVRARSGYCNVKPADVLQGQPVEKHMEELAAGTAAGVMGGTMQATYLIAAANQARVDVAMEVPSASVNFEKDKGKFHADVNVLGIAYRPDGTVGARFSDDLNLNFEKDDLKQFQASPMRYENQFMIAPGEYKLDVVLSSGGQSFGKYETPLKIDPVDGKSIALSGIALCTSFQRVADMGGDLDAELIADRTPLIVGALQMTPSGNYHFKHTDKVALYVQAYDPHLTDPNPPKVQVAYRVVDVKTSKTVEASGWVDATEYVQKGKPLIPIALKVPFDNVPASTYRLDLAVSEGGTTTSPMHSVTFDLE